MPRKSEAPTIERLARSFALSLEAQHKSPRTVQGYLESIRLFDQFQAQHESPRTVEGVRRAHVEQFIADQLARLKPSTAATRYKGLKVFFAWCEDENELDENPMARTKSPTVPDVPVPVITEADVRKLLKVCEGRTFVARRDTAVIRLLYDTGVRRGECAGLTLDAVDLYDTRTILVMGKGRRPRIVPFGAKTARALDAYLRVRDQHPLAHTTALWLGQAGRPFGDHGIRQMLERRGEQAGVRVHAHLFRHAYVHQHLAAGGHEGDLMLLTGWRSRQMLTRYAQSTAAERARSNYVSPGDRL